VTGAASLGGAAAARIVVPVLACVIALVVGPAGSAAPPAAGGTDTSAAPGTILLADDFTAAERDLKRWTATRRGDLHQASITVEDTGVAGGRLVFTADTRGTDDATVKSLGVRSRESLATGEGLVIEYTLDWREQDNASYLKAGVYLAPVESDASVKELQTWIGFEYVGVPPGRGGRGQLVVRDGGSLRFLEREAWPQAARRDRVGRRLGTQEVRWLIDRRRIVVWENGEEYYRGTHGLDLSDVVLFLELEGHSNYPPRSVAFGPVRVRRP